MNESPPANPPRRTASVFRSPAALARFFLTAGLLLALDLWTKSLAFGWLCDGVFQSPDGTVQVFGRTPYHLIPGWLEFDATANQGAIFGLAQGQRMAFLVISCIAAPFLIYLFSRSGRRWFFQIVLGLLMAGVLGNFYDRLELHYVRDMIHIFPRWPKLFPYIFNVADSCLCLGVGLMLVMSAMSNREKPPAAGDERRESA